MPRYYYNLKDARELLDDERMEFPDIYTARKEAIRYSGEVIRDGTDNALWAGEPWQLLVTEEPRGKGKTCFTLTFSVVEGRS